MIPSEQMSEHRPGTRDVDWWAEHLTGGFDHHFVEEAGGLVLFAMEVSETECSCEEDCEGTPEQYTATCLACESKSLLRALDGETDQVVEYGEVTRG